MTLHPPKFRPMLIGPYTVNSHNPGKVWINNGYGEGGEFSMAGFKKALAEGEAAGDVLGAVDKFFWENF